MVAPYTGVWIETRPLGIATGAHPVAPYTGVWIETGTGRWLIAPAHGRSLHGSVD